MKYKAVIYEEPMGTKVTLYEQFMFFFWLKAGGYKPLTSAKYLIDEALERWKHLYGDNLTIIDKRENNL